MMKNTTATKMRKHGIWIAFERKLTSDLSINPSASPAFSRLFTCFMLKLYVFSLVFAPTSRNKGNFFILRRLPYQFMATCRKEEASVEQYNRELIRWKRQVKEKSRPPEKYSVLKHLFKCAYSPRSKNINNQGLYKIICNEMISLPTFR